MEKGFKDEQTPFIEDVLIDAVKILYESVKDRKIKEYLKEIENEKYTRIQAQ